MKISMLLLLATLASCSNDPSDLIIELIKEKRKLQDSVRYVVLEEIKYKYMAKGMMSDQDTTKRQRLIDSSALFLKLEVNAKKRIEEIDFSLDSLSKMK